ncbi:hypothetical protein B0H13DRAFT_1713917 [Mycena leptocephala]|nr:hypothetical protein B0H13DRAFT_1713917 [Mycena leptocephala]
MASPPGLIPLPPNIGSITSSQLIGTLLNFFLFGTLFIQVYVYNACFPKDRPAIKWLVYSVFLGMALCICFNAADAHYWYGSGFGDIIKFGLAHFAPLYISIMGSVIALAVQLFFCYRISVFRSGAIWWSAIIAAISFLQAAGGMGAGIKTFIASNEQHDSERTVYIYLWLVGDAVADLLIAGTMTHLLTKASEPQTQDIIRGVVRLLIETNTFSASVAIIGLALFAGMPDSNYWLVPCMILPGIYANTLLVLLNIRAAPTQSHLRADYVSAESQYASDGTFTANASSAAHWKAAGPATLRPLRGEIDYAAGHTPAEIPMDAFVAAPNPHEEDARRVRLGSSAVKSGAAEESGERVGHEL